MALLKADSGASGLVTGCGSTVTMSMGRWCLVAVRFLSATGAFAGAAASRGGCSFSTSAASRVTSISVSWFYKLNRARTSGGVALLEDADNGVRTGLADANRS